MRQRLERHLSSARSREATQAAERHLAERTYHEQPITTEQHEEVNNRVRPHGLTPQERIKVKRAYLEQRQAGKGHAEALLHLDSGIEKIKTDNENAVRQRELKSAAARATSERKRRADEARANTPLQFESDTQREQYEALDPEQKQEYEYFRRGLEQPHDSALKAAYSKRSRERRAQTADRYFRSVNSPNSAVRARRR